MSPIELADLLEQLSRRHIEKWRVDKEPHSYPDGTTHFNHVRFTTKYEDEELQVQVASYVTPDLAELLCLLHNNLPTIIAALRANST